MLSLVGIPFASSAPPVRKILPVSVTVAASQARGAGIGVASVVHVPGVPAGTPPGGTDPGGAPVVVDQEPGAAVEPEDVVPTVPVLVPVPFRAVEPPDVRPPTALLPPPPLQPATARTRTTEDTVAARPGLSSTCVSLSSSFPTTLPELLTDGAVGRS